MRFKQAGNKFDNLSVVVKNAESSSSIPRGTPVALVFNGTDDGLGVVLPATSGAAKYGAYAYGVVTETLAAAAVGEAIVFGYVAYAIITRATRAASSDSWTSSQSVAQAVALNLDTINNAFLLGATVPGTDPLPKAALAESISSMAASASATSDTRTAITTGKKVFVRMM